MDDAYAPLVEKMSGRRRTGQRLKVIYTRPSGSGNVPVHAACMLLDDLGYKNVTRWWPSREQPDGNFPDGFYQIRGAVSVQHCPCGNAEARDVDIIIGTDGNTTDVGVVGETQRIEFVVSLPETRPARCYFLKTRAGLPDNKVVIKTIVTSELGGIGKSTGPGWWMCSPALNTSANTLTEYEPMAKRPLLWL